MLLICHIVNITIFQTKKASAKTEKGATAKICRLITLKFTDEAIQKSRDWFLSLFLFLPPSIFKNTVYLYRTFHKNCEITSGNSRC